MNKTKKILVVEDEPAYVTLLKDTLSKNYEIMVAPDGKAGLSAAKKIHPDLIILDIRMPIMDGMTMLRHLRKDDFGKTAKVIVLTNIEANEDIVNRTLEDKPENYFVKSDIRFQDLVNRINDLLN